MRRIKPYKPGLRMIKTAIAVGICVAISYFIANRDIVLYSGISCIICIQQTNTNTVKSGLQRLLGMFFGGLAGFLTVHIGTRIPHYYDGIEILLIAIAVLVVIYLSNLLKITDTIPTSNMVLLSTISEFNGDTLKGLIPYILNRILYTFVGVVIAVLVNRFIFRYNGGNTVQTPE